MFPQVLFPEDYYFCKHVSDMNYMYLIIYGGEISFFVISLAAYLLYTPHSGWMLTL